MPTTSLEHGLQPACEGHGPLLQRDYWARVAGSDVDCRTVGELLATRFWELAPPSLARFERADGSTRPLAVGDELDVSIRFAGVYRVRVVHRNANSLTVSTLPGHPEAGRITFGAYRHESGDVIFHIRSRARSRDRLHHAAWVALGRSMQTNTWTRFIDRIARLLGTGVVDFVYEETSECPEEPAGAETRPTFVAKGG